MQGLHDANREYLMICLSPTLQLKSTTILEKKHDENLEG